MKQKQTNKGIYIVCIIMGFITVASLAFSIVMGILVLNGKVIATNTEQAAQQIEPEEVLSLPSTEEAIAAEEEAEVANADKEELPEGDTISESIAMLPQSQEFLEAIEEDAKAAMKSKMKELVSAKDGGPMTMLRYFFPENLIFYDENAYVFADIIDSVQKHELKSENFQANEKGEMEYLEEGVVTSHKGIDVSKYQGEIDWEAVKADGVEYAFIRLGLRGYQSGKLVLDEYYQQNMRGANEAGVMAGVYFFTQAVTVEEAKEEAAFVLENLADYDVPYPVVLDVEMITGANGRANNLTMEERTDICIAFCEAVKEAGYTPMIYGNIKCFVKMLDITRLEAYEKWFAFYDEYMYFPYQVSVWQYTEKGSVKGIKGDVDLNISYKTW